MSSLILAAEVPDVAIAGIAGLALAVFTGISSWALITLVRLTSIVAGLEARMAAAEHDTERHEGLLGAISLENRITASEHTADRHEGLIEANTNRRIRGAG